MAFRNAVALSAVLPNRTSREGGSWFGPVWSDSFDFYPLELRPDGSQFDLVTSALNSTGFELQNLSLTPDIGIPRSRLGGLDEHLALRLGHVWTTRHLRGREIRKSSRVFRSLEIAYQAGAMSFKNYASLHEAGVSAVLWVNAIEVLASPCERNVNRSDGVRLVGEFSWEGEKLLKDRRYRVRSGNRQRGVNLAQKVYDQLHKARSKFVHGDKVSTRLLLPLLALGANSGRDPVDGPVGVRFLRVTPHASFRPRCLRFG